MYGCCWRPPHEFPHCEFPHCEFPHCAFAGSKKAKIIRTGAARMSSRTQAVDHLQIPQTTLRPILIFGLFRGFQVQDVIETSQCTKGRQFPPSGPSLPGPSDKRKCAPDLAGSAILTPIVQKPYGIGVPSRKFFATVRAYAIHGVSALPWIGATGSQGKPVRTRLAPLASSSSSILSAVLPITPRGSPA